MLKSHNIAYGLHGQWVPCVQWRCRWLLCPQPSGRTESKPSAALQLLNTRADSKGSRNLASGQQDQSESNQKQTHRPYSSDNLHGLFSLCLWSSEWPLPDWWGNLCSENRIKVQVTKKAWAKVYPMWVTHSLPWWWFNHFFCDLSSDLESWCSVYAGDHPAWPQRLGWCSQLLWWYPAAAQTARPEASVSVAPPDSPTCTSIQIKTWL